MSEVGPLTTPTTGRTKRFHIGDIISVLTGRLVSLDDLAGVYNILGWMVGAQLLPDQLPQSRAQCAPLLRATFRELAALEVPPITSKDDVRAWFKRLSHEGVELWRDVPQLAASKRERRPS